MLLFCAALCPLRAQAGALAGKRIVVLHSYHHGFTWTDDISSGIREAFRPYRDDVELCFEFMDTRRIYTPEYFGELARLYALKYAGRRVDLVIASDDHAYNFMLEHGQAVFGEVPVVFCSVSGYDPASREGRQITGLLERLETAATLETALRLHPSTRRVNVITDQTRTGRALRAKAEQAFAPFAGRVEFRYLDNLDVAQLDSAVAQLGEGDIVFLFIFTREQSGRVLSHEQNLRKMARYCHVPIYAVWDFYLGHGIVGGKLTNGTEEGRMAGALAVRILQGESASSIPPATSPTTYMFDYAQLRRFGVSLSALPPGSVVVNRPFSFYQTYRTLIWSVLAAFAVLVGLVLFLILAIVGRRRAERELWRSREQLQLVLDGAELGMWDWHVPSGAVTFNERWARMLGYELSEIAPHVDSWEKLVHPDDLPEVRRCLDEHLSGKTPVYHTEHRLRAKDGTWVWVLDRGKVVERDAHGAAVRATGTHLDVTAQREAAAKRRELETQMQHAQKLESLGVLAGGIAHDFNNLLTGILGHANLALLDLPPSAPARQSLSEIELASRRAAELCRQMLAYSGKGKFVLERLDLSRVVREMGQLLEVTFTKRAVVRYNFAEDLPRMEGDPAQVGQVVMNLITNASEAVGDHRGSITLTTGAMECRREYLAESLADPNVPEGRYVFLEVADTGCGMDADTLGRIFDPFYTTKFTGRGLGLSAVLGIVRGHHGAIRVYSEPGRGTTFKVLFPAVPGQLDQPAPAPTPEQIPFGEGLTVLVVDDDTTVRRTIPLMLKRFRINTLVAADGREALQIFGEHRDEIACVILDLTMPEMDGVECFRELRTIKHDVCVVLSSGYNEQDATQRFAGRGLAGFIQKPYVSEDLLAKLHEVLAR